MLTPHIGAFAAIAAATLIAMTPLCPGAEDGTADSSVRIGLVAQHHVQTGDRYVYEVRQPMPGFAGNPSAVVSGIPPLRTAKKPADYDCRWLCIAVADVSRNADGLRLTWRCDEVDASAKSLRETRYSGSLEIARTENVMQVFVEPQRMRLGRNTFHVGLTFPFGRYPLVQSISQTGLQPTAVRRAEWDEVEEYTAEKATAEREVTLRIRSFRPVDPRMPPTGRAITCFDEAGQRILPDRPADEDVKVIPVFLVQEEMQVWEDGAILPREIRRTDYLENRDGVLVLTCKRIRQEPAAQD